MINTSIKFIVTSAFLLTLSTLSYGEVIKFDKISINFKMKKVKTNRYLIEDVITDSGIRIQQTEYSKRVFCEKAANKTNSYSTSKLKSKKTYNLKYKRISHNWFKKNWSSPNI